jgi:hypothetical protein
MGREAEERAMSLKGELKIQDEAEIEAKPENYRIDP